MPELAIPLTKHTLLLRTGDFDILREKFAGIGAGPVVRRIVSDFIDKNLLPNNTSEIDQLRQELKDEVNV